MGGLSNAFLIGVYDVTPGAVSPELGLKNSGALRYNEDMYSTYTLNTDELTPQFISVLQGAYPGKKVEIVVQEAQDETEYLLKDPQLLEAVGDIKNGKNLVSVPFESL